MCYANRAEKSVAEDRVLSGSSAEVWEANADAIGVTPEDVALLAAKTEAANCSCGQRREQAQQAAEAATLTLQNAINDMAKQGAAMLMQNSPSAVDGWRGGSIRWR